ncbi:MAG TPA: hypothetical protein VIF11_06260 [Methylomirabilota bacterium]|jgi:hypothetical protein
MRLGTRTIGRLSMLGLLSGLTLATTATTAQAQWRDERRGPVFRDEHARVSVHHDDWHFDRGHGWRFEHRPGFWSPYYVWWWTGGRVVMLGAPSVTVVNYPTGQYQLRGDGITVPYYWAWVPAQAYIAAPPPPAVPAAPDMTPAGSPSPPPPAAG